MTGHWKFGVAFLLRPKPWPLADLGVTGGYVPSGQGPKYSWRTTGEMDQNTHKRNFEDICKPWKVPKPSLQSSWGTQAAKSNKIAVSCAGELLVTI